MNIKKAIIAGVILYALVFLFASGLMSAIPDTTSLSFRSVMVVAVAVLTFLVAKYYYFKGMKIKNPVKEGLLLGIVIAIVSFLIEIPVMVYGFAAEQGWGYFMSWSMILGYILIIVVPILAAYKK